MADTGERITMDVPTFGSGVTLEFDASHQNW